MFLSFFCSFACLCTPEFRDLPGIFSKRITQKSLDNEAQTNRKRNTFFAVDCTELENGAQFPYLVIFS